jgi:hypothetical protein
MATLLSASLPAFAGTNPCQKAARAVVSARFHVSAELNQDEKQPSGSGTYKLVIRKDDCYYDVSVKMKKTSATSCEADKAVDGVENPLLDEGSANCG